MSKRLLTIMAIHLAVVVAAGCSSGGDAASTTTTPTTTPTTTTTTTTTTTVRAFSSEEALSVADAYFEAYNAGDVDAVLALFTPDATFAGDTRTEWEQLLVWNAAQGTLLSPPDCTVTGETSGVAVSVSCPHDNLDALVQAVDGPPVPIQMTLVVGADGIREWIWDFGSPDFNAVGIPFGSWMSKNYPEGLEAVGFGNWTTVEEAEENGIRTARYAAEWATFLDENGCRYRDGC